MATEEVRMNTESIWADLLSRIVKLEDGHQKLLEKSYEFDKELSGLQIDIRYIREGLDQTKGGIQKLLWGIGLVFVTYVVGFVVSGGLNVTGG